jgi:hypothetical protein
MYKFMIGKVHAYMRYTLARSMKKYKVALLQIIFLYPGTGIVLVLRHPRQAHPKYRRHQPAGKGRAVDTVMRTAAKTIVRAIPFVNVLQQPEVR